MNEYAKKKELVRGVDILIWGIFRGLIIKKKGKVKKLV